jgi:FRG domain
VRKEWSEQHINRAADDLKLKEQWEEIEPFWKPWFRGHADASWHLKPKLYRDGGVNIDKLFRFEEELRGEFKRRGSQLAEGLRLPDHDDEWGWYSLMQHYAAPTRLLDWSDGVLTALYFAIRENPKDDQIDASNKNPPGACVWMLDPYHLNRLSFYPADDSLGVALPDWDSAKDYLPEIFCEEKLLREYPLAIDPPLVFQRLSSQRSHFTVFGTHPDGLDELGQTNSYLLERIIIPAASVPTIKSELELSGISETTIFPDLEALSRELDAVWKSHFGAPPASRRHYLDGP